MNRINGFNLFECIVVLVIVSILSILVQPLYRNYMAYQATIVFTHEFVSLLEHARVSAMIAHEVVTVCASHRAHKCDGKWEERIIAFTDVDGSGTFKSGDKKLASINLLGKNFVLHWNRRDNKLQFLPSGNVRVGNGTFIIENVFNQKKYYSIVISLTGRVRSYGH